jgi:hypothetical protein
MRIDLEVAETDVVVIYHQPDVGLCSMSGKENVKGYVVTIIGAPVTEAFLCVKSIDQMLTVSLANNKRAGAGGHAKNGEKQHA